MTLLSKCCGECFGTKADGKTGDCFDLVCPCHLPKEKPSLEAEFEEMLEANLSKELWGIVNFLPVKAFITSLLAEQEVKHQVEMEKLIDALDV